MSTAYLILPKNVTGSTYLSRDSAMKAMCEQKWFDNTLFDFPVLALNMFAIRNEDLETLINKDPVFSAVYKAGLAKGRQDVRNS